MWIPFPRNKENWVKVLLLMYQNKIITNTQIESGMLGEKDLNLLVGSAHKFDKEIKPKFEEDIDEILLYLTETGLVEANDNTDIKVYGLTQEGLQLAHQIKNERQRQRTNLILILLSAILALPVLIDILQWIGVL